MRNPARLNKREEFFNRMIASIKRNWDVVEGGVEEEDDGEEAENQWEEAENEEKFWTYVEDANERYIQNSEGLFIEEERKDLGA